MIGAGKTIEQQLRMECLKSAVACHVAGQGVQRTYDAVLRTAQAFYEWVDGKGDHILTEKATRAEVEQLGEKFRVRA